MVWHKYYTACSVWNKMPLDNYKHCSQWDCTSTTCQLLGTQMWYSSGIENRHWDKGKQNAFRKWQYQPPGCLQTGCQLPSDTQPTMIALQSVGKFGTNGNWAFLVPSAFCTYTNVPSISIYLPSTAWHTCYFQQQVGYGRTCISLTTLILSQLTTSYIV